MSAVDAVVFGMTFMGCAVLLLLFAAWLMVTESGQVVFWLFVLACVVVAVIRLGMRLAL